MGPVPQLKIKSKLILLSSEFAEEDQESLRKENEIQDQENVLFPSESESDASIQSMSSGTSSIVKKEEKIDYNSFSKLFEPEETTQVFKLDKNESCITDDYSKFVRAKAMKRKIKL